MDMEIAKNRKWLLTIVLLYLVVSSSSQAAQQTPLTTPLEPIGEAINSPTNPIGNQNQPSSSSPVNQPLAGFNQPSSSTTGLNQPIPGQPSSSVNQPLAGVNQPSTGFTQPAATGLNQPILGQPASSSINQPLTGLNQPSSTGLNQPIDSSISSSSTSNPNQQPFSNRLNQNGLSGNGVPFLNGNSKLKNSITKIVFVWTSLLLALHVT